jgi:twitching motility protein PilT
MEVALANLIKAGVIDIEEGLAKSSRPEELQRLVGGATIAKPR